MNGITWIHIAGGVLALAAGAVAVAVRKGRGMLATGGICLLAGVGDLRFILRGTASTTQRISRHLWRMCFAFFIATGSFFLGQQDVLPQALRGSPILLILAFAPFALMLFWLVLVRFARGVGGLKLLDAASGIPAQTRPQG